MRSHRIFLLTLASLALVGNVGVASSPSNCCGWAFSLNGPLNKSNFDCVRVFEDADPDAWGDNYFCGPTGVGMTWQEGGEAPPNLTCTNVNEPSEPAAHAWADNKICLPHNSDWEFAWSFNGPIQGARYTCVPWNETADHDSWNDNFLCVRRKLLVSGISQTFPLVSGQNTTEHPEVGRFKRVDGGSCTATLVAPRVALTAAHCIDFSTNVVAGNYGTVVFGGTSRRVVQTRAYGTDVGGDDNALLILDTRCDGWPSPANIGTTFPARGSAITIFGFGCSTRSSVCNDGSLGGGNKQKVVGKLGDTASLCPGDSGGPVFQGERLVGVNSGSVCWTGQDIFANATKVSGNLQLIVADFKCQTEPGCPDGKILCALDTGDICTSSQQCQALRRRQLPNPRR